MNCCAGGGYGGTGDDGCGNVEEGGCVKGVGDSGEEDRGNGELHGREQKVFLSYLPATKVANLTCDVTSRVESCAPSYIDKDQIKVHACILTCNWERVNVVK